MSEQKPLKPKRLPLSPMLVQYLVGLYALKGQGESPDIRVTVGDMVRDESSDSIRDVDVTVTLTTPDGVDAFMVYEVKDWKQNLSQDDVDGLINKLNNMPDVTHRAIVCTSGYSDTAIKKAAYQDVDLYVVKEWTRPINETFPIFANMTGAPAEAIGGFQFYLEWRNWEIGVVVDGPPFQIAREAKLFDAAGKEHQLFPNFGAFTDAMCVRSTERLLYIPKMQKELAPLMLAMVANQPLPEHPPWPYAHTLEVAGDDVYIFAHNQFRRIDAFTLTGELCWQKYPLLYLAMEKVPTGEMFGGAIVACSPVPGQMWAFIFPSDGTQTMDIRRVQLSRAQLNIIKQLDITVPTD